MGTDAYLQIVLPGMGDWQVEEVRDEAGHLFAFKLCRVQTGGYTQPGAGKEHTLDEVRRTMQARADALNAAAEPLVLPKAT